jgi:acyl carrier protein
MTDDLAAIDLDQLRAIIAEILELDPEELTDDAHFADDLGVDSLMGLELQIELEAQYNIRLTEEEMRSATSLRTAQELLSKRILADEAVG